jgi:hypothetical protein
MSSFPMAVGTHNITLGDFLQQRPLRVHFQEPSHYPTFFLTFAMIEIHHVIGILDPTISTRLVLLCTQQLA